MQDPLNQPVNFVDLTTKINIITRIHFFLFFIFYEVNNFFLLSNHKIACYNTSNELNYNLFILIFA